MKAKPYCAMFDACIPARLQPWVIVVLLSACSHHAADIQAEPVPSAAYDALSCRDLEIAIERLLPKVETLRFQLDERAQNERVNFLGHIATMGLPWMADRLASEQNDRETLYSRRKGELKAMRAARMTRGCSKSDTSTTKIGPNTSAHHLGMASRRDE